MECMDSDLSFQCPAQNTDPDFRAEIHSRSVKCQVCHLTTRVDDMDPRAQMSWFKLEWGPNMLSTGSVTTESMIDGYKVYIVDACERKQLHLVTVLKSAKAVEPLSNACCTPNAYSVGVTGTIPSNGKKLMIVPFKGGFELEVGRTVDIADSVLGDVKIIQGKIIIEVDNSTALKNDKIVLHQMLQAIADVLGGVDSSMIRITEVISARRLEEASVPRKLAGDVVVNYEILIPRGSRVSVREVETSIRSLEPSALRESLNNRLTHHTVTAVEEIAAPTVVHAVGDGFTGQTADAALRTLVVSSLVELFVACVLAVSGARLV